MTQFDTSKLTMVHPDMHPEARKQHPDGSMVNTCSTCRHSSKLNAMGQIRCDKHDIGNMWFGNCDYWCPK